VEKPAPSCPQRSALAANHSPNPDTICSIAPSPMHAHFEPLRRHDAVTSLLAFERRESHFPFHWHHHPEWELTGILQGSGQRLVGDHAAPYEPGDLVLVGPHLPHTWASRGPPTPGARHRAAGVHFSLHALPADLLARPEFQAIRDLLARAERGLQFSPDIARSVQPHLQGLGRQTGLTAWLDLVGLLAILATDPHARPLATARFHPQPPLARQAQ